MSLHTPVLLEACLNALALQPDGIYLDCTFGRGGHSRAILEHLNSAGRLLAFDQDPQAIASAEDWQEPRLELFQRRFDALAEVVSKAGYSGKINGILFDLGVSSPQLDDAARGFSFMRDGPLDMRMDTDSGETAAEWLARAKEKDIANVLYRYGEERHSRRIARAIVAARGTLTRTRQLAELIAQASPAHDPHKHPATRSFQAIRIFLNHELEALENALPQALEVLAPGGRLAVISFHSLEDRVVKRFMRDAARGGEFPPDLPVTADQFKPRLKLLGKAISASDSEIANNPRARSAVLRVAEKLAHF